jgi:endogenous inhibitor of DNA gyrase (YacG/DUF329 family)
MLLKTPKLEEFKMQATQAIRCPNCGSPAERQYLLLIEQTQTQCPTCDYFMLTCSRTGNVVEAYAPGIPMRA